MNDAGYTANDEWDRAIGWINDHGEWVTSRGLMHREILSYTSTIDMSQPIVTVINRKMNYRFMCAEASWILHGSNEVEAIKPYCKKICRFSDHGQVFQGAYGPKVTEQMSYVYETLYNDLYSRQAIISIWRESPRKSKDIPCTLSLQFLVRDKGGSAPHINCIATMRSSDLWLGWVYDVFNFSMITAYLALMLKPQVTLNLGTLYLTAGSQHLYNDDYDDCMRLRKSFPDYVNRDIESREYTPMSLHSFNTPEDLMIHLDYLKMRNFSHLHNPFLKEMEKWA